MANNLICSKRVHLDDALSQLNGVQFYFSCVTAVSSNAKASQASGGPTTITYPGVAYFVAYRQTDNCNENQIFTLLHNMETEPAVQPIHTRGRADGNGCMDAACRELFQVVKDHNSDIVMNMVNASNHYCLATYLRTMSADESDGGVRENRQPRYPSCPCRLVVVNAIEFDVALHDAVTKLTSDGIKITIHSPLTVSCTDDRRVVSPDQKDCVTDANLPARTTSRRCLCQTSRRDNVLPKDDGHDKLRKQTAAKRVHPRQRPQVLRHFGQIAVPPCLRDRLTNRI